MTLRHRCPHCEITMTLRRYRWSDQSLEEEPGWNGSCEILYLKAENGASMFADFRKKEEILYYLNNRKARACEKIFTEKDIQMFLELKV